MDQTMTVPAAFSTPQRGNFTSGRLMNGTLIVSGEETWGPLLATANTVFTFSPGSSGLPRLDFLASGYELWRLRKCRVKYLPQVATSQGGAIYVGIDFDPYDIDTSVQAIQQLNPRIRVVAWQPGFIDVPINRVNKSGNSGWMYTSPTAGHDDLQKGFAVVISNSSGVVSGEIIVEWSIEFAGPQRVGATGGGSEAVSDSIAGNATAILNATAGALHSTVKTINSAGSFAQALQGITNELNHVTIPSILLAPPVGTLPGF